MTWFHDTYHMFQNSILEDYNRFNDGSMPLLIVFKLQGAGLILSLRPANERQRYVTMSLFDWAQA